MKKVIYAVFTIMMLPLLPNITDAGHGIVDWQDNRKAAVSITFDDGYYSQPSAAINLMTPRNMRGTLFVILGSLNWAGTSWDMYRQAASEGHEIGSHTLTHPFLTDLSESELREELGDSRAEIDANVPSQSCLTLAYPYGYFDDLVIDVTEDYYISARAVWSPDNLNYYPGTGYNPIDFYQVGGFSFDSNSFSRIVEYFNRAEDRSAWLVLYAHDIDPENEPDRYTKFIQMLDELEGRDIWIDTYGAVVRYMREKIESNLSVISENETEITLSLTHSLDQNIYNEPLTIRSTVPSSWTSVRIGQGTADVWVDPVNEGEERVVYYDAIPNMGTITLSSDPISPDPVISFSPASLNPTCEEGTDASDQTISIWNSGEGTLQYTLSVSESWLDCSIVSGTANGEQDSITIFYDTSMLAPGIYTAAITIQDPAATNSPRILPVYLTVSEISPEYPEISVDPSGLNVSCAVETNASARSFEIWNSGAGTLNYTISVDQTWLDCDPTSGSSDGETDRVTVSYDSSSLASGNYSANITIQAPDALNSPLILPVTLTVTEGGSILNLNFEEGAGTTAFDTSGNTIDGSISGAAYTTDSASGGYALSFDGVDDRVACPWNPILQPSNLSASLWVKQITGVSTSTSQGIIRGAYGDGYTSGFRIIAYRGNFLFQINFGDSSPKWMTGGAITQDEWIHIVLTYDHQKVSLYQNGELITSFAETRDIKWSTTNSDLYIGYAQWYFGGLIDHVMLFDSALTPEQVQELYAGAPSETPKIGVGTGSLSAFAAPGTDPPDQTFSIWNSGAGTLSYVISDDADWLACSPESGTSHGELNVITVAYNSASLPPGEHTGTISISDTNADNSPQSVSVLLKINSPPLADAQNVTLSEDTGVEITLTGTDPDNNPLTYAIVSSPQHGTLSGAAPAMTYTPDANFNGADSFTFKVNDGSLDSAPATVSITVNPVNDPPVADPQTAATPENTALAIVLTGSDIDGDALTFTIVTQPENGTITGTPPSITYTPNPDFSGGDTFTFKVNDGSADSAAATVAISVSSINDPPVADAQTVAVDEDTFVDITLTGEDPDNDPLTYAIVSSPQHGTLSGAAPAMTYTPDGNFNGADSFTFKVSDGTLDSAPATVSITVNAVNDPPVADPLTVATPENTALAIVLTGSDIDGDALTFTIATQPENGTITGTPPFVTYTPNTDFHGNDSFSFMASDEFLDSTPQSVSITVSEGNETSPIIELNFEEGAGTTAFDTSGNGLDGVISGAAYTEDNASGAYALSFDGVDDRVTCPSDPSLKPSDLTVSLWVKQNSALNISTTQGIIRGAFGDGYSAGFRILIYRGKLLFQINFGDSSPKWMPGDTITPDEWIHIAFTYDRQSVKVYQNGALFAEYAETRDIRWSTSDIGLYLGYAQWYFGGMIDNLILFDTALSGEQILGIYNAPPLDS